jgi:ATP-dependent Clp protease ATP-binding subunit ClpX
MMLTTQAQAALPLLNCSFCGRDNASVRRLIAGPGVHICDGCVEACNRILRGEERRPSRSRQGSPDEEAAPSPHGEGSGAGIGYPTTASCAP